jgi:signal transduction histidine kinase
MRTQSCAHWHGLSAIVGRDSAWVDRKDGLAQPRLQTTPFSQEAARAGSAWRRFGRDRPLGVVAQGRVPALMLPVDDSPNPDRTRTNVSLGIERAKTDADLAERLEAIDEAADAVIAAARGRADAVLAAARSRADRQFRPTDGPSRRATEKERVHEDQTLRDERASADETLRVEREQQATLPSPERDQTDQDLCRERGRSDLAISTRDAFLGIVSHDLRNMLHGIVSFAAVIAKIALREGSPGQIVESADRIRRAGARMGRLVGDLVDVASIEAGVLAVRREVGDPTVMATEAVETFQAQAFASGIKLMAEVVPPVPHAAFDPARIIQVLTNLLSNALKFTPVNGTVVVRVERAGDEVQFAVVDTGPGIPRDKLEAVFERFLQVNEDDRRGVGLGLYISKCIVQGHGGRIWAESGAGVGATLCFTLPIH